MVAAEVLARRAVKANESMLKLVWMWLGNAIMSCVCMVALLLVHWWRCVRAVHLSLGSFHEYENALVRASRLLFSVIICRTLV